MTSLKRTARIADVLFRYFQPAFLAELAAMLWLLIIGTKEQPLAKAATT